MTPDPSPTVYVVDDDRDARESVIGLARAHGVRAEGFASAEEFLAVAKLGLRGCVVSDLRMGGSSGIELLKALKASGSMLPVIIITGYAEVMLAVKAIKIGAYSFLEKPCDSQLLWAQISEALDFDRSQESQSVRQEEIKKRLKQLTPDEFQVLHKLLDGAPNKQIAADLDIGLRTVELRRATILKKMEADSLAQLVRMAMIAGVPNDESGKWPGSTGAASDSPASPGLQ